MQISGQITVKTPFLNGVYINTTDPTVIEQIKNSSSDLYIRIKKQSESEVNFLDIT